MRYRPFIFCILLLVVWRLPVAYASEDSIPLVSSTQTAQLLINQSDAKLIEITANLLADDIKAITGKCPEIIFSEQDIRSETVIIAGIAGHSTWINQLIATGQLDVTPIVNQCEAYSITTLKNVSPKIKQAVVIAGSDKHGTAYGLLDISRQIGVSPWIWWADVLPDKRTELYLTPETRIEKGPSVRFRGIFINDEDWGLLPWSNQTSEPSTIKGHIGPATYQRIFELLLRLRANTLWPAMHESTRPFYFTEGNKEMADKYGIYIGTSHCEPLMRNVAGEWTADGNGDYDYVNNSQTVYRFWEQRIQDVAGQDNIYTLGMRGVHDGKMQGAQTLEEQKTVLTRVFNDQRGLLKKYVNKDLEKIPQVFIPYKEVLDIYNYGLQVPDDVTLMWCDDNYGYIRHFPDEPERKRNGGNGVYYHVSYWGRPHDYLWLGTTHPALIYQQMKQAYHSGIQKIWILNVGDIKPSEYQIELFLDMAWDLDKVTAGGTSAHLKHWLKREFGKSCAEQLLPVMQEHYRLAYIRKPEFMGHTRVEESDPAYKIVKDLPWSEREINERLSAYNVLSGETEKIAAFIPNDKQNAYFELVKYPVQATTQMNRKLLYAQLARHGMAGWQQSDAAYDSIVSLTHYYNTLNNGKWNHMMDAQPRKLPVFERIKQTKTLQPLPPYRRPLYLFNGADYTSTTDKQLSIEELGYGNRAVSLSKDCNISFQINELSVDSIEVEICLLPNHPVEGHQIRFGIALDDSPMKTVSYQTEGRSEEWKENVLRNQAVCRVVFRIRKQSKRHSLTLTAIDAGVVIDRILVYKFPFSIGK
jgi:hypothetical protein